MAMFRDLFVCFWAVALILPSAGLQAEVEKEFVVKDLLAIQKREEPIGKSKQEVLELLHEKHGRRLQGNEDVAAYRVTYVALNRNCVHGPRYVWYFGGACREVYEMTEDWGVKHEDPDVVCSPVQGTKVSTYDDFSCRLPSNGNTYQYVIGRAIFACVGTSTSTLRGGAGAYPIDGECGGYGASHGISLTYYDWQTRSFEQGSTECTRGEISPEGVCNSDYVLCPGTTPCQTELEAIEVRMVSAPRSISNAVKDNTCTVCRGGVSPTRSNSQCEQLERALALSRIEQGSQACEERQAEAQAICGCPSPPTPRPTRRPTPSPVQPTPLTTPRPNPTSTPWPFVEGSSDPSSTVSEMCSAHPECAAVGFVGACCPTSDELFLDCCDGEPTEGSTPESSLSSSTPGSSSIRSPSSAACTRAASFWLLCVAILFPVGFSLLFAVVV